MKNLMKPAAKSAAVLAALIAPITAPGLIGTAAADTSSAVYQCEYSINGESFSGDSKEECDALAAELGFETPDFPTFEAPSYERPAFGFDDAPSFEVPDFSSWGWGRGRR